MPFHVAAAAAAEPAGASHQLTAARKKEEKKKQRKNNNFPSVVCLPLYCSKTSPSRPVTPPHPSSSPPLPSPPSILSGPHTSLHSGSCRVPAAGKAQDLKKYIYLSIYEGESHCRPPVTIFTSPLTTHRFPWYCTSLLPSLSSLASSLSSCV